MPSQVSSYADIRRRTKLFLDSPAQLLDLSSAQTRRGSLTYSADYLELVAEKLAIDGAIIGNPEVTNTADPPRPWCRRDPLSSCIRALLVLAASANVVTILAVHVYRMQKAVASCCRKPRCANWLVHLCVLVPCVVDAPMIQPTAKDTDRTPPTDGLHRHWKRISIRLFERCVNDLGPIALRRYWNRISLCRFRLATNSIASRA